MPDYNQPAQGKVAGEMPGPAKPAPIRQQGPGVSLGSPTVKPQLPNYMNEGRRPPQQPAPIKQAPQLSPPFQPAGPAVDEFGRPLANMGGLKDPMAPVGDFNQRRANAMAFSAPPQMPGAPGGMPGTGGGFMAPGPPQPTDPYEGGFAGGLGQQGAPSPGGFQPPPQLQRMLQQPGFMEWLMRMFQGRQGQLGPAGQPPQPQFQPVNQGPPR